MKIRTILIAILTSVLSLCLQANEAFPEGTCKRWDHVDYQRKCGEVPNVNSLLHLRQKDDCAILEINARSHWNASGILFAKGFTYEIEVLKGDKTTWCDASIESTAEGWKVAETNTGNSGNCPIGKGGNSPVGPDVKFSGLTKWFILASEYFRRDSESNWFKLIGVVAGTEYQQGPIGKKGTLTPKSDGEFCSFANDLSWKYSNNSGILELKITRQ